MREAKVSSEGLDKGWKAHVLSTGKTGSSKAGRGSLFAALFALLCLLLALGGCASSSAITVNGRGIPSSEFEFEVDRRLAVIKKSNPIELKGDKGERVTAETKRQVATELVRAALVREEARKLGVKLPADEVNRRLAEERGRVGEEQFAKDLKAQDQNIEQFKRRLEEQALVDRLGAKVSEKVSVTGDEAESFYLTNKELFSQTLMVRVAHILLENESQADMIAAEAKRGEDFARLAGSFSKDTATRGNGGDLGWIEPGTREPAFEEVAFSLKPGQVSGVVRASDGFQVMKVLDRREASTPPFSEVKGEAIKTLTNRKKDEVFSDWLRTVYANARVEAGSTGKWDPRLGMVVQR